MPRRRVLAPLFAASTLVLFAPGIAAAQDEAPDCIAIVAEMLAPSPSAGSIRAAAGCPVSGPVTLANRWTRRGARSAAERAALVEASTWMRDGRIYDAVVGVTRDEARPLSDRLAGIRLLAGYAESGFGVSQQGEPRGAGAGSASAARSSAAATASGSVALAATMRDDVRRELTRLASIDRDGDVRYAAQKAIESIGPLAPSKAKVARNRAN